MICKKCNKEFEPTKGLLKFCSLKCRNSREWNEEDKLKKSNSAKTSEKVKICNENHKKPKKKIVCEICKSIFYLKSWQNKRFCNLKCLWSSDYYKNLKSEQTKETYRKGKKVFGGTTKWYEIVTTNGKIKVQGSYEINAIKILEKQKELNEIKNWEYTLDRIDYIGVDKLNHTYLIDFKVWRNNNEFYYVETKGHHGETDILKWTATKQKGFELQVWFKEDLKKLLKKYEIK